MSRRLSLVLIAATLSALPLLADEAPPLTVAELDRIRPTEPGFARYRVRPQLGDLGRLELTAYAPIGRFEFASAPVAGGHEVALTVPFQGEGELLLPAGSQTDLPPLAPDHSPGLKRFRLRNGQVNTFTVRLPKNP